MQPHLVLVTGATSGIGRSAVNLLAERDCAVVVHGRDERAVAETFEEIGGAEAGHRSIVADYSRLEDVRRMASDIGSWTRTPDVIVNNAGTYQTERHESADGLELVFQVNHLAPFLLTNLLRQQHDDRSPLRVITVSSGAHAKGEIDFSDLMHERDYDAYRTYADSKLANVLFCYALARRFDPEDRGETFRVSLCLDPGATDTKMLETAHPEYRGRPVEEAAAGIVCLAIDRLQPDANGTYFRDCVARHSSKATYDIQLQDRLWDTSVELAGL